MVDNRYELPALDTGPCISIPKNGLDNGDMCDIVMACIVMAYITMAYIVMAYMVIACAVTAYIWPTASPRTGWTAATCATFQSLLLAL